jgi:hypothetical protein
VLLDIVDGATSRSRGDDVGEVPSLGGLCYGGGSLVARGCKGMSLRVGIFCLAFWWGGGGKGHM